MRYSLRVRITLIILGLAIGPQIILALIVGQSNFADLERQALALQREVASTAGSEINAFIKAREQELVTLDEVFGLGILAPESQRTLLSNLLQSQRAYQELTLLDNRGQERIRLSRTDVTVAEALARWSDSEVFLHAAALEEFHYEPVRFDDQLREPLLLLAMPMFDQRRGEVASVLVAELRFKPVWDLLSGLDLPDSMDAYVVDQRGLIIAHKNPAVVLRGDAIELPPEAGRGVGLAGTDVFFAWQPLRFGEQDLRVVVEQPVSTALALPMSNLRVTVLITTIALAAASLLTILAVRRLIKPIESLATSVTAVGRGDFSLKVEETSGRDEIGQLTQGFNTMQHELSHLLQGLEHEIAERQQIENALIAALERLKEMDAMKSKFIADVSHEMRTPLANLMLYMDLLQRGDPNKKAKYFSIIEGEGKRIVRVLNGILSFAELQQSIENAEMQMVDLNRLVAQTVADHQPLVMTRDLKLTFSPATEGILVFGDTGQLKEIVKSLLANAITYTPSGEIRVSTYLETEGDRARLVVEDSGIGLDEEEMKHCFDRFYRGKRIGQYNIAPGVGLGLAKVKQIVAFHKGSVEVESEVDRGSTFAVFLPAQCGDDHDEWERQLHDPQPQLANLEYEKQ